MSATFLVNGCAQWTRDHWLCVLAAVQERALAAPTRRVCVLLHDLDAANRVESAIRAAVSGTETEATRAREQVSAYYAGLRATLGLGDADGGDADEQRADQALTALAMLRRSSSECARDIHGWLAATFTHTIAAFWAQAADGVTCLARVLPDPLQTPLSGLAGSRLPAASLKSVTKWLAEQTGNILCFPVPPGSDASGEMRAAFVACCVESTLLEVWGDRLGFYSCTLASGLPLAAAHLLRAVTYTEARELCAVQAGTGHPGTMTLLEQGRVALQYRSVLQGATMGTTVRPATGAESSHPVAFHVTRGVTLVSLTTCTMWHTSGFLKTVFAVLDRHGLSVDVISSASTNITFTLDRTAAGNMQPTSSTIQAMMRELVALGEVEVRPNCVVVALIGSSGQLLPRTLSMLPKESILMISQAANSPNCSVVIEELSDETAVAMYEQMFADVTTTHPDRFAQLDAAPLSSAGGAEPCRGCCEMAVAPPDLTDNVLATPPVERWWWPRQAQLVAMAPAAAPVYVYDLATVAARATQLQTHNACDCTFFAVKANYHPAVLRALEAAGVGFECVSQREVEHVVALFPDLARTRILFTANFAPRGEYERALQLGAEVTIDNVYCLRAWPDIFAGRALLLRIDPGVGHGHHAHVKTAGRASKFGIAPADLPAVVALCHTHSITVKGLHCHSGSGIMKHHLWEIHARLLANIALEYFPHSVKILNVGGGIGIPYSFPERPFNFVELERRLRAFRTQFPQFELWMEAGRFLVAEAGVLLTRVSQTKEKLGETFVGLCAGMNSLLRPALYGAHHALCNISKHADRGPRALVNVCGPICESADMIGRGRLLPASTQEGDVFLIDCVGAYGRAMLAEYNLRAPGDELLMPADAPTA